MIAKKSLGFQGWRRRPSAPSISSTASNSAVAFAGLDRARHRGCGSRRRIRARICRPSRGANAAMDFRDFGRPSASGRCRSPRPARRRPPYWLPYCRSRAPSRRLPDDRRLIQKSYCRRHARPPISPTQTIGDHARRGGPQLGLGADDGVALAMVGAAFGMADDDIVLRRTSAIISAAQVSPVLAPESGGVMAILSRR